MHAQTNRLRNVCDTDVSLMDDTGRLLTSFCGKPRLLRPPSSFSAVHISSVSLTFLHQPDRQSLCFSRLDNNGPAEWGQWVKEPVEGGINGEGGLLIYGSDFSFVIPWLSLGKRAGGCWRGTAVGLVRVKGLKQLNNVYMPTASGWCKAAKMLPS